MQKDLSQWVCFIMQLLIYSLFITGCIQLMWIWIKRLQRVIFCWHRLPVAQPKNRVLRTLYGNIEFLMITAGKEKLTGFEFLVICGIWFLFIAVVGYMNGIGNASLLLGSIGAGIPYVLLRIRLESIRQKGSMEGEELVSELLRQYRITGYNIYQALENTVIILSKGKVTRTLCFQCLVRIRDTGSPMIIRQASDLFYYGIHTNWSRMLATNIRIAAERGINVCAALEDVLQQLRQARVAYEERRRLNGEATRMTVYLIPILYLATVGLSVGYMGISGAHFLKNQFGTAEGVVLFFIGSSMFVFNLMAIEMVNNRKFDC